MKSWKPLCIYLDSEPHPPNKPKVYLLHSLVNKTRKAKIKTQGLLFYVHSVIRGTDVKLFHGSQGYINASCMSLIIFLRLMTARYFVCQFGIQNLYTYINNCYWVFTFARRSIWFVFITFKFFIIIWFTLGISLLQKQGTICFPHKSHKQFYLIFTGTICRGKQNMKTARAGHRDMTYFKQMTTLHAFEPWVPNDTISTHPHTNTHLAHFFPAFHREKYNSFFVECKRWQRTTNI